MDEPIGVSDLVGDGVPVSRAALLAANLNETLRAFNLKDARDQERAWRTLMAGALRGSTLPVAVHGRLFRHVYRQRETSRDGPAPAWFPGKDDVERANVTALQRQVGVASYEELHRWSAENRDEFWRIVIARLGIPFRKPAQAIRDPASPLTAPRWLPGAELNIGEACWKGRPDATAIVYGREGSRDLRRITYAEFRRLADRVAHGLDALGLAPDARVALYLPMTPEAVAAYLGIIWSGRCVVGIADASAPLDVEKRVRISGAVAIITADSFVRDGRRLPVYSKATEARAPRCIVLPSENGDAASTPLRPGDIAWKDFLGADRAHPGVARRPEDATNILFSSGTTKDPKAIVWTQTTPIKCLMDAHCHQDVHEDDVLCWPTSYGWMMGPWLTFASLGHGAAMAIYNGSPVARGFAEFVRDAGVTMLGVVPKLVRSWSTQKTLEGVDWSRIRRFSSTGETSDPAEMFFLMQHAGYRPVIEYCGGTEIGGGYVTGTMAQPASPAKFTTPALGLDFLILDERGKPATRGEVAIVAPSIGLSNAILNYDHAKEYYEAMPAGPEGGVLRRHGDQLERMGRGFYKHHGRVDDMINVNGVKTSVEELRGVIGGHPLVYDTKPIAVDVAQNGQRVLVVYAIPRDRSRVGDARLGAELKTAFSHLIKERLNPLLSHVHDVVLVAEMPQAGPGKTRTQREFAKDYLERSVAPLRRSG